MADENKEKTVFYTDQGTYCYTKMPFGLKNAGSTYQRLVESTFQCQIRRNLEAYMDDMVIKSKNEKMLLDDIAETFDNLKKINMKLNPKRCFFGVEEGKFLGHIVMSEGIRDNPKKTKALAVCRMIPTIFQHSEEHNQRKKHECRWTKEAEEAFQQMKNLIMDLPSLTPPWEKETLYAYLAVLAETISAVLLTDRKERQCLMQYVSKTLNEAERNYAPMEKLALSLIHMTRWLRRYFEAHPVKVITNQPIRNILNNTETSGKLAKYFVELGAYNITYIPRNTVNGQVLADFLSEAPEGEKEELYFQMPEGSGACLVLIGPNGIKYTYALRLTFPSTNNEAEYEALLAELRIARQMNISNIEVKVNSKLVASQINRNYEASKDSMIKYMAKAKECVGPLQANYVIREIHMGYCGMHVDPRIVVRKAVRKGYYWLTMHEDAKKEVEKCNSCQIHASVPRFPKTLITSIMASWPFYQCGIDILGPLPFARGGAKFLIVAIDYFTKWIEAKPLVKITGNEVIRFVMDKIICRFGLAWIIITDNGTQLLNDPFKSWCGRFKIHQMNTAVAHPQANGLVERDNRSLMEGIKTRLGREKSRWVDDEAVITVKIGIPTYRTLMIREGYNEGEMRLNLDLLQEMRETCAIREARYKTKMEQCYNKKVCPSGFRPGEFVFRRNKASRVEDQGKLGPKREVPYRVVEAHKNGSYKQETLEDKKVPRAWHAINASRVEDKGKLGPKWEGPYRVVEAYENGSYKLETLEDKEVPRAWHAINLRKCYM
nr:reverse transcriptase domain-containing protein [Tanacetum cinerariifolium]